MRHASQTILVAIISTTCLTTSPWLERFTYPFYHTAPFKDACAPNEPISQPIIIFPGCNDWCPGVDYFEEGITKHTNSHVVCVEYAPKIESVFNNMEKMIERACRSVEEHRDLLKDGFTMIGLSMGGLIARGVIQMCDIGQYVNKLITLGAPHMGVAAIPSFEKSTMIEVFNKIFKAIAYSNVFQAFVGSTNFFKIPENYNEFLQTGTFLGVLNNEGLYVDQYRRRMTQLKEFVMVGYSGEYFLQPAETVYFGYFDTKDTNKILKFNETRVYKQDLIGLRYLHERGRVHFSQVPGRHQDPKIAFTDAFKKIVYYCY